MRASAQLAAHLGHLDHAHVVAVLLAEEHHRAQLAGVVARRDEHVEGMVGDDVLVDGPLDVGQLVRAERAGVAEVEPQLVGPHVGAGLRHVVAEPAAERGVQEVRRRVVGHRGPASLEVDVRADALAGMQLAVLEPGDDDLVVVDANDVLDGGAGRVGLDPAAVGDLAPALGVERRLAQLHEHRRRRPGRGSRPPGSSRRTARSPRTPSGSRTRARPRRRARRPWPPGRGCAARP